MATFLPAQSRRVKDSPCPTQGRSEVHGAKNNERHGCGRRRAGEPAVSRAAASCSYPPTPTVPPNMRRSLSKPLKIVKFVWAAG